MKKILLLCMLLAHGPMFATPDKLNIAMVSVAGAGGLCFWYYVAVYAGYIDNTIDSSISKKEAHISKTRERLTLQRYLQTENKCDNSQNKSQPACMAITQNISVLLDILESQEKDLNPLLQKKLMQEANTKSALPKMPTPAATSGQTALAIP